MKAGDTASRRGLAIALTALTIVLGVTVPVVDRFDLSPDPVVESDHAPGECVRGHDHLICNQVGANHAVTVASHEGWGTRPSVEASGHRRTATPRQQTLPRGHRSRAPPAV